MNNPHLNLEQIQRRDLSFSNWSNIEYDLYTGKMYIYGESEPIVVFSDTYVKKIGFCFVKFQIGQVVSESIFYIDTFFKQYPTNNQLKSLSEDMNKNIHQHLQNTVNINIIPYQCVTEISTFWEPYDPEKHQKIVKDMVKKSKQTIDEWEITICQLQTKTEETISLLQSEIARYRNIINAFHQKIGITPESLKKIVDEFIID